MSNKYIDFEVFTLDDGQVVILSCNTNSDVVVIPETYKGNPVVMLNKKCFINNKYIKKVVLPDSIILIGEKAFKGCRNLNEINLNENIRVYKDSFLKCPVKPDNVYIMPSEDKYSYNIDDDDEFEYDEDEDESYYDEDYDEEIGNNTTNKEFYKKYNIDDDMGTLINEYVYGEYDIKDTNKPDDVIINKIIGFDLSRITQKSMDKAIEVSNSHNFNDISVSNDCVSATYEGRDEYYLSIYQQDDGKLNFECTCPSFYNLYGKARCKHLHGLILYIKENFNNKFE